MADKKSPFLIVAYIKGKREVIDEADSREEAEEFASEYRIAMGVDSDIEVEVND